MDSRLERNELFCGLLDVLNVAIGHKLLNEAESVLDGLRALKPRMTELDTFEAWIAMRRGKVKDAIRLLQHVEAAATRNQITPFAKALPRPSLPVPRSWRSRAPLWSGRDAAYIDLFALL